MCSAQPRARLPFPSSRGAALRPGARAAAAAATSRASAFLASLSPSATWRLRAHAVRRERVARLARTAARPGRGREPARGRVRGGVGAEHAAAEEDERRRGRSAPYARASARIAAAGAAGSWAAARGARDARGHGDRARGLERRRRGGAACAVGAAAAPPAGAAERGAHDGDGRVAPAL